VGKRAFQRFSTYRGATLAGVFTNTIFAFVFVGVFGAVYSTNSSIDGFDRSATLLYVFGGQAFLAMTGAFGDREISDRIRSGDVASDLYRPVDFQAWWLAHDLGKSLYHALFRGIPPFLVGVVVLDLPLPASPVTWSRFFLAAVVGVVVAFGVRFLANVSAFWLLESRGVVAMVAVAQVFLGGHVVPLYLMSDGLEGVVRALPFASITAFPVEVLAGGHVGDEFWVGLAVAVGWASSLLIGGRVVLGRAERKLVIQGG
jgi:ABC-2 type transport system permease protein